MGTAIDRIGDFRGQIVWAIVKPPYDSGAEAIEIVARIDEAWNYETEEWEDWRQYDMEVEGLLFVYGKGGKPNQTQITALHSHAGWDGTYTSISAETWKPSPCQFSVEEDEYKGKVRYRIAWLNAYDGPVGGSTKPLPLDKAKALDAQHGGSVRAIIGNAKRNATAPTGKPQSPPPQTAPPLTAEQTKVEVAESKPGDDDIPFSAAP